MTVPAEYSPRDKHIMRECAHSAELIDNYDTEKLQFISERRVILFIRLTTWV